MPLATEASFVLFDIGYDESTLRLGDLVLGKYQDPFAAHHYTSSHVAEPESTVSETVGPFSTFHKEGPRGGVSLDTTGCLKLRFSRQHHVSKIVVVESGEKRQLHSPTKYLKDVVLADEEACKTLTLWLSSALTDRVLKFKWAGPPKIWMLTGLYLCENTSVVTVEAKATGFITGISSETIKALITAPIGASIDRSESAFAQVSMKVPERKVWAAQYQLLNTKYVSSSSAQPENSLSTISLYLTRSKGSLRNSAATQRFSSIGPFEETTSGSEEADRDQVVSFTERVDDRGQDHEDEDHAAESEYQAALDTAVSKLKRELDN